MGIFQKSVLSKYLLGLDMVKIKESYETFKSKFCNSEQIANIKKSKEEQYQEGFFRELFVDCLGYTINPTPNYNITTEFRNVTNAKKADGAIINNGKTIAVMELKGWDTQDLREAESQAFGYKYNHKDSKYVIVSNFGTLRLYVESSDDYEDFKIFNMCFDEYKKLYLLLHVESIFSDLTLKIRNETLSQDEVVSEKLYKDYHEYKLSIFQSLLENNEINDKVLLLKKTQKLLDRILFMLFAEDRGLIEPNTVLKIIQENYELSARSREEPLYDTFKIYFGYIDKGNPKLKINGYNGGLFAPDELLDKLIISDLALKNGAEILSKYDYSTEVDVNILGHIFENSLNDIDELRAEAAGESFDISKSKRKKEGVFYTPKYITKHIIDNTLGKICIEKKKELGIMNIEFDFSIQITKRTKKQESLLRNILIYREFLKGLKILDPAVGSGAFLNQALEFLIEEHEYVDKLRRALDKDDLGYYDISTTILEENLFGVDINEEAVELARLSLWLRTAEKGRKLNDLSKNIKVGNSIIDSKEIVGDLAFVWEKQFPEIMANGGFDIVVGNPPYVFAWGGNFTDAEKKYYTNNYSIVQYQINTYTIFVQKFTNLAKDTGSIGLIIPNSWMTIFNMNIVRKYIINEIKSKIILNITDKVFTEATVNSCILIGCKSGTEQVTIGEISKDLNILTVKTKDSVLLEQENYVINISGLSNTSSKTIINKINEISVQVVSIANVKNGLKTYETNKGTPPQTPEMKTNKAFFSNQKVNINYKKFVKGYSICRYLVKWDGLYLEYGNHLAAPREERLFNSPRIMFRQIPSKPPYCIEAVYSDEELLFEQSISCLIDFNQEYNPLYVLSVINSKIISYWFRLTFDKFQAETFPQFRGAEMKLFPIPKASKEVQSVLADFAKIMIEKRKGAESDINEFINWLKNEFPLQKITEKIEAFYSLTNDEFITEVKSNISRKFSMSPKNITSIIEYFDLYKNKVSILLSEISKINNKIDIEIYKLCNLSSDEIKTVEEY